MLHLRHDPGYDVTIAGGQRRVRWLLTVSIDCNSNLVPYQSSYFPELVFGQSKCGPRMKPRGLGGSQCHLTCLGVLDQSQRMLFGTTKGAWRAYVHRSRLTTVGLLDAHRQGRLFGSGRSTTSSVWPRTCTRTMNKSTASIAARRQTPHGTRLAGSTGCTSTPSASSAWGAVRSS